MTNTHSQLHKPVLSRRTLSTGLLAGVAGGLAEIIWIAFYQNFAGKGAGEVARGVTQSVLPSMATGSGAITLGIVIHMTLAAILGLSIAALVRHALPKIAGRAVEPVVIVGLLACVWAVNFFVILPVVNPAFVTLVPYGATLISKLLFGVAAAIVFTMSAGEPSA